MNALAQGLKGPRNNCSYERARLIRITEEM